VSDQSRTERGFTLLEMLVVGVIILIVAGITIPAVKFGVFSDPLKQAAISVAGFARKAEQTGRASLRGCRLVITPAQNSIAIQLPPDPEKAAEKSSSTAGSADLDVLRLPEGVRLQTMDSELNTPLSREPVSIWVNNRGLIDSFVLHISDDTRTLVLSNQPFLDGIQISFDDPGTSGG
jgi:prepilin-type N-terminal cleavage/methylation domain-containing protein